MKLVINGETFHTGDSVSCQIFSTEVNDAKIYVESERSAYICHNLGSSLSGSRAPDLLGYGSSILFRKSEDGKLSSFIKYLHLECNKPKD